MWKTDDFTLWFDAGTVVNLRIEAENWNDQVPQPRKKNDGAEDKEEKTIERKVPYSIEVWDPLLD